MKKIVFMLSIVLFLSCTCIYADNMDKCDYEISKELCGFTLVDKRIMDEEKTVIYEFEHTKTGADLIYISNDDENRVFNITFKTPALDNTGVNHILEHICVSGSKKYPFKDVIFTISNQTYNSYVNALTGHNYTSYPVASMNEKQLLKLADVYLDCVFNPIIYEDKNIFKREAWRYEINDFDEPLNITGTVFNEMKGALANIETAAVYNTLDALYPNSSLSHVSGGVPEQIRTLTYPKLLDTHQQFYHPSNSLTILYGNLNLEDFLELIDREYFSKYDKMCCYEDDISIIESKDETVIKTYKFPVSKDTDTENSSLINYAFSIEGLNDYDRLMLEVLTDVLNNKSSALNQKYSKLGIGDSLHVDFEITLEKPILMFSSYNSDELKYSEFKALVDEELNRISVEGVNKSDLVSCLKNKILNSNILKTNQCCTDRVNGMAAWWATYDNIDYCISYSENLKEFLTKVNNEEINISNTVNKYLANNNHNALVTTIPQAGLAEAEIDSYNVVLENIKESFGVRKLYDIIKGTNDYKEWNDKSDEIFVDSLQEVKISELNSDVFRYDITDKTNGNIRYVTLNDNLSSACYTNILFNTSYVSIDNLHYLKLFSDLLGKIGTENLDAAQLEKAKYENLNSFEAKLGTVSLNEGNIYMPVLSIEWIGMYDNYQANIELINDIVKNTSFEDTNKILEIVKQLKTDIKSKVATVPIDLLIKRGLATQNNAINYQTYVDNIAYYNFLCEIEKIMPDQGTELTNKLNDVKKSVLNSNNMICLFAGNEEGNLLFEKNIEILTNGLDDEAYTIADYSELPKPSVNEAIDVDSPVSYNMISASFDNLKPKFSGKILPIGLIIYDKYLIPKIRYDFGAYDAIVKFNSEYMMIMSYRDPKIKETYDVFDGIPFFLESLEISQDELDRYLLKAYSKNIPTEGKLTNVISFLNGYIMGYTEDYKNKILGDIKSLQVSDMKYYSTTFEDLLNKCSHTTVSNGDKINLSNDMFEGLIVFK